MQPQTWYVITRLDICPHCDGTTWAADPAAPHKLIRCLHCNQHGVITHTRAATADDIETAVQLIQQEA